MLFQRQQILIDENIVRKKHRINNRININWRMMQIPESLCFRVFQARFFPNCSILDAKDSNTGSYAWKSILGARDVIRKGMVWRIGNGQSVRIKEDKWLPVKPSRVILSPLPSVMAETKVSSLINPELGVWKSEEVK